MMRVAVIAGGALAVCSPIALAQQSVPVLDLPAARARTTFTLGAVLGVRELSNGRVLVNDAGHHQVLLLDSTLAVVAVPIDSTPGSANSYGPRALPIVRYIGDSSLTVDYNAGTLLMLGPDGRVARAVASPYVESTPPYGNLTMMLRENYTGVDEKGRVLFQGFPQITPGMLTIDRLAAMSRDSVLILRADFDTRKVDTVARVKNGGQTILMGRESENGPVRFSRMPVEIVDVWGVLSDGSIAIVRGQDYHIDWILPDGTARSTAKLPFDWKRLTDEDKQRLIDSVRADAVPKLGAALAQGQARTPNPDTAAGGGARRVSVPAGEGPPTARMPMQYIPPALKDIPDYHPSVRMSAATPDLDGNLWILPNSSAQSRNGELVYDVANAKGDFHRVRVPLGQSIAGFGTGGVVYLQSGDRTNGFYLERTRLPK